MRPFKIKKESLMTRIFKKTAALVGTLLLICLAICAIAVTAEFIMWICDLHMSSCKS